MSYMIPAGFILTGTCAECGGPVLTRQLFSSSGTEPYIPHEQCSDCGKVAKPRDPPTSFGPIRDMHK